MARVRSRCRRAVQVAATTLLAVAAAVTVSGASVAAMPPLDNPPSSAGMPGAEFFGSLIGWGKWLGLAACGLAFIYGAAMWKGMGSQSAGRAADGKGWVIGGAIGTALIGMVGFVIPMLYNAANA